MSISSRVSRIAFILFLLIISTESFAASIYLGSISLHPSQTQFLQEFIEQFNTQLNFKEYELIGKPRKELITLSLRHRDRIATSPLSKEAINASLEQIVSLSKAYEGVVFTPDEFNPKYELIKYGEQTTEEIESSAALFSTHYGKWGQEASKQNQYLKFGNQVKMTSKQLLDGFMFDDQCGLVRATISTNSKEKQIGHAFFRKFEAGDLGEVIWITQLVVDPTYRDKEVAANLIRQALGNRLKICGLASSHPYAVRSIESATGLVCDSIDPGKIALLVNNCGVPYVQEKAFTSKEGSCIINTEFFVDHTHIEQFLEEEKSHSTKPWKLGSLPEGHEFLAFVFPKPVSVGEM